MVVVDVLIIGGGPHALTLASLLSSYNCDPEPGHDSPVSPSEPPTTPPEPETPGNKRCGRKKKKGRRAAADRTLGGLTDPALCPRSVAPPLSLCVVDSYGVWTSLWESQFSALNIPHLRSHTLVHTDPLRKKALLEFVLKQRRSAELHSLPDQVYILDQNAFFNDMRLGKKEKKRLNSGSSLRKSSSFSLPGTKLSVDFFRDQVERYKLDKVLVKGTVERIRPVMEEMEDGNGRIRRDGAEEETEGVRGRMEEEEEEERPRKRVKHFEVRLQDGGVLEARRVVMATGPTRAQMANVPSWVERIGENFPEERLQHTVQLMHPDSGGGRRDKERDPSRGCVVCEAGQRVMVVGGGLTSAHVVSIALQQGASHVTWVMRKHLQLKQFDVGDVEGLVGRYSHVEHGIKMDGQAFLRQFYNERSVRKRLTMISQARKGGAVTPEAYTHLQPFIERGQVEVRTYCQVSEARWCYRKQVWSLSLSTGHHWTGDRIWLATGCKLDANQDPLLAEVMEEFPIQVMDGWPCVSESLQWSAGCPLYLMGQYAALQVGPHAVNLAGGQAASMRIARDLLQRQQQDGGQKSDHKPTTEDYIEQMRGLLWL